ncbi:MAG: flagellar biosynthetic protein FliR [Candidatus Cellulosilyticum pullistercoris]|uniref:Flagellar biosynthetic protein FliR n=1 Tax=Candidatus Cellulosilyticum pullistercoris TaxID=2838521 RepID=A0A9E2NL10_9FIRM|nr:flagellar biosynthetic protein FliR [Candidatus Cellulosilyticum pullistercoris]
MEDLVYLYRYVDVLLIIFVRILGAIAFLPIIEETKIPRIALVGFSLGISLCVFFKIDVSTSYYDPNLLSYTILIVKETVVGLVMGFVVKIFFQIYPFVGSLLSMQGGLGMSMVMDPTAGTQSTLIGRFYNLGLGAFFVLSGGYHWFIHTLVQSFELIPINQEVFSSNIVMNMINAIGIYFELGLKLAMPIVSIILVIDFAMGILARTVPQMNMFVIGIPLKMLIMFILMVVTIQVISKYNTIIIEHMISTLMNMIQEMRVL